MSENEKKVSGENTTDAAKPEKKATNEKAKRSPKKKKKISAGKIILALIIVVAILLVAFPGFRSGAIQLAKKIPGVNKLIPGGKVAMSGTTTINYYTVTARDITTSLTGTGTLQAYDSYNITATVSGEILSADFEEMDKVNEDDILFVIDSSDVVDDIAEKKKDVAEALQDIYDLKEEYDDLKIYSDYAGKVREVYVEEGDRVSEGTNIAYIVDNDKMLLEIPFFAANTDRIAKGAIAEVTFPETGEVLVGLVTEISNTTSINEYSSTVRNITISVENPGGIVYGMKAYARAVGTNGAIYDCSGEGTFKYNVEETIKSESSGELKSVNIKEGEYVKKGQFVAEITTENLDKQLESLQKAYDNQVKALEDLEDRLEDYTIRAPISGTIVQKNYKALDKIGQSSMSSSTNLAIIYDMSKLVFDLSIDELDLPLIEVGQKVNVTSDSIDNMVFEGIITKKSIVGSSSSGTTVYPVTVEIEGNDYLLPGMNINAEIILSSTGSVPAVPVGAVSRGNIVKVTKQAVERPIGVFETMPETEEVRIEIGATDGSYIEIRSGLSVGDVIVYEVRNASSQQSGGMAGMMGGMGGMGGMMGGMPTGGMPSMPSGGFGGGGSFGGGGNFGGSGNRGGSGSFGGGNFGGR